MRLHTAARVLARLGFVVFMSHAAVHAQLLPVPAQDVAPEPSSGYTEKKAVTAKKFMIATANPHATRAGQEMLKAGGSAVDAAIAAALMLNLTEPQSSGIGGGAFIVSYDAAQKLLNAYDGREKAPASARGDRFLDAKGKPLPLRDAINSGKSVGVPGLLRVMELAHQKHGKLPWARLFEPTIRLAENGFAVSERLHHVIKLDKTLRANANARAYFYDAAGEPLAVGATLKNPAFAAVLRRVAKEGPDAFYKGEIARDISAAVNGQAQPGDMTPQDIAAYQARERAVLCGHYRAYKVCGMPPPSSGGIAVLAMLGALERFPMSGVRPNSTEAVHLFSEAGRLAYADRDYYVGDPDFVNVPATALVSPEYLKTRSALIRTDASMKRAAPGVPAGVKMAWAPDEDSEIPATSHISVIDSSGNAVSMTTTIEAVFGSHIMVHGFLLNNQMTDFALAPEENGLPVANRIEGGKRPRSTMSPTLVFDADGRLKMTVGSPGGSAIINYVAKTLVGVLDWGLDVQQAISLPNMGSRNRATEVELGSELEKLSGPLKALGHEVQAIEFTSGLQGIVVTPQGLVGGADPRREGFVLGE
ncbi:gamma-glutamyltranspeptidase [Polaromonas sp. CF318]|uniref:gamma-glutamyltransferase n=1 Tax=Polaromonas sp. CF318 TaxID=1144318 RepID=UPI000270EAB1|nr:gamma-glutamyltransferase [Polaromonas sp. CF318]EJL83670.1 gamma-glutamyltranspeptidase [Polaromonas sp. CF318]